MFMTGRSHFHAAHSDAQAHLRFALSRLGVDWRHLPAGELEVLLRHLLMAEHRCMPHRSVAPELPTNRWLLPRLRWRRQLVANRLVALGGKVSHATLSRVLPRGTAWPGIGALVGRQAWDPVLERHPRDHHTPEPLATGLERPGDQPVAQVAAPAALAANSAWTTSAKPSPRSPAAT